MPRRTKTADLGHVAEQLRPLAVAVADLAEDPANARLHPERNLRAIMSSLQRYGQRKPVVVRREGMIVEAGNGTLAAARALGWTHLAAVVVDDDPATATGFSIADNRTGELAEWDGAALSALIETLNGQDVKVDDLGFTDAEVAALVGRVGDGVDPPEEFDEYGEDLETAHTCPKCGYEWS